MNHFKQDLNCICIRTHSYNYSVVEAGFLTSKNQTFITGVHEHEEEKTWRKKGRPEASSKYGNIILETQSREIFSRNVTEFLTELVRFGIRRQEGGGHLHSEGRDRAR